MEPIEEQVKRDRMAASKRPELKTIGTLNQIGKHVYAYAPYQDATTAWKALLSFNTSPSQYYVGVAQLQGLINYAAVTAGDGYTSMWKITFNGAIIFLGKTETHLEDSPTVLDVPLVIPPNTAITIERYDEGTAATRQAGASFTGEAFNA